MTRRRLPRPRLPPQPAPEGDALPEGKQITMPQLGMAQDSGQMVGWLVELGAQVGPDDLLFEVETDKATMEVPAGASGYLAATLAQAGEDVAVGAPVAILTAEAPANPVARSAADAAPATAPAPSTARTRAGRPPSASRPRARPAKHRSAAAPGASSPRPRRGAWRWNRGWTLANWSRRAIRNPTTSPIWTCCAACPTTPHRKRPRAGQPPPDRARAPMG